MPDSLAVLHTPRLTPLRDDHERCLAELLRLRGMDIPVRWIEWHDDSRLVDQIADETFWLIVMNVSATASQLDHPGLRRIVKLGRYTARLPVADLERAGVAVTTVADLLSISCAEHTIASTMALLRRTTELDRRVRAGDNPLRVKPIRTGNVERRPNWLGLPTGHVDLVYGKTVALIGLGEIGIETALRFTALGATVRYTKRAPEASDAADGMTWMRFPEILDGADIVSLHVPYTVDTHRMLGESALARLARSAVVVNTARGGLIDEDALADRLDRGLLRGAALDVFAEEPPAAGTRLLSSDRVLLSPHVGVFPIDIRARYQPVVDVLGERVAV